MIKENGIIMPTLIDNRHNGNVRMETYLIFYSKYYTVVGHFLASFLMGSEFQMMEIGRFWHPFWTGSLEIPIGVVQQG